MHFGFSYSEMYNVIQTYSDLMGSDDLPGSASEKSWDLQVHTCCPDLYIERDFCESNMDVTLVLLFLW